jgi:hypothetical protein
VSDSCTHFSEKEGILTSELLIEGVIENSGKIVARCKAGENGQCLFQKCRFSGETAITEAEKSLELKS